MASLTRELCDEGAWDNVIALQLGWSLRTQVGEEAAVDSILIAADLAAVKQGDEIAAQRMIGRVLNRTPYHRYALKRAMRLHSRSRRLDDWRVTIQRR